LYTKLKQIAKIKYYTDQLNLFKNDSHHISNVFSNDFTNVDSNHATAIP